MAGNLELFKIEPKLLDSVLKIVVRNSGDATLPAGTLQTEFIFQDGTTLEEKLGIDELAPGETTSASLSCKHERQIIAVSGFKAGYRPDDPVINMSYKIEISKPSLFNGSQKAKFV